MKVLNYINKSLEEKPLFFLARELERGLGYEDLLQNYHIICIEQHPLIEPLRERGVSIFCLEEEGETLAIKSVGNLVKHPTVRTWIKKQSNNGFYAQSFYTSGPFEYHIKNLGGELLQPTYKTQSHLENKINQTKLFKKYDILIPKTIETNLQDVVFDEIVGQFASPAIVVQSSKSHTGTGTWIVSSADELHNIYKKHGGIPCRVSEFIQGDTYTLNICTSGKKPTYGPIQYQIPGIEELGSKSTTTIGNDFSFAKQHIDSSLKELLLEEFEKVTLLLEEQGFKGLAGVDVILSGEKIYVIELNARRTANIPFQTYLERIAKSVPQALLDLYYQLGGTKEPIYDSLSLLEGAQLFLRAKSDIASIRPTSRSYIYNMERKSPKEENIKPLHELKENEALMLVQIENQTKRYTDELARIQSLRGIVRKDKKIRKDFLEKLQNLINNE